MLIDNQERIYVTLCRSRPMDTYEDIDSRVMCMILLGGSRQALPIVQEHQVNMAPFVMESFEVR